MDGSAEIERNRAALKRIVAQLLDMAGLAEGDRQSPIGNRQSGAGDAAPQTPTPDCRLPTAAKLPRHLYLFILRLLRPAEAAARRLIIAASRGLVVPPPKPPRRPEPKPQTTELILRKLGLAVMVSRGDLSAARKAKAKAGAKASARRSLSLPLYDPPRRLFLKGRRRTVPPHAAPRVMFPGFAEPHKLPPPPSPDDPISAARLVQRIAAHAAALDDLPGQAKRFARWKARRDAGLEHRTWPIRRGRLPGGRLTRWDSDASRDVSGAQGRRSPRNIREIDEILAHAHSLALYALEYPDTS